MICDYSLHIAHSKHSRCFVVLLIILFYSIFFILCFIISNISLILCRLNVQLLHLSHFLISSHQIHTFTQKKIQQLQTEKNLENLLVNPFVAAIYKQTEPYMGEFLQLSPKEDLEAVGFKVVEIDNASRSHRVYVATKPEEVQ